MKLRFLGQAYTANNDLVPTIAIPYIACFRGQTYKLRRPVAQYKSQLGVRKYRGVAYGAN